MAELALVGSLVSAAGAVSQGLAQKRAGKVAQRMGDYEALGYERNAAAAEAGAQAQAFERQRDTDELISKQVAEAAASGGGVENPTILDIVGRTAQRGSYLTRSELYQGESRAAGLRDEAAASRYRGKVARAEGKSAMAQSILGAVGDVAGGGYGYGKKKAWWLDQA